MIRRVASDGSVKFTEAKTVKELEDFSRLAIKLVGRGWRFERKVLLNTRILSSVYIVSKFPKSFQSRCRPRIAALIVPNWMMRFN